LLVVCIRSDNLRCTRVTCDVIGRAARSGTAGARRCIPVAYPCRGRRTQAELAGRRKAPPRRAIE